MKTLTVLVGAQGVGKTSYAKKLSGYRISQDEMGSKEHFYNFEKALARGEAHIIIDRINHTREQRYKYISLAKQYNYKTTILEFFLPYSVCFESCLKRENHPTLPQDKATIRKALDMYFTQYETILDSEADIIVRSKNNPMVLDLTDEFNKSKRTLVFGDLHGCFSELNNLLDEVQYNPKTDLLLGCGDFADRGPEIEQCYSNLTYSAQGNHDCVKTDTTEILTDIGFIPSLNITKTSNIAQFDKNGNISFSKPINLSRFDDSGYYRISSNKNNLKYEEVSRNHKVFYKKELVNIKDLDKDANLNDFIYSGNASFPRLDLTNLQLRFITQIVMDATLVISSPNKKRIQFKISKPRKIERLQTLLRELNIPFTFKSCKKSGINKLQPYYIRIYGPTAKYYIDTFFDEGKKFPNFFKYLNKNQLLSILEEISVTDGSKGLDCFFWTTTDKRNLDIIQESCIYNNIDTHYKNVIHGSAFENAKPQYMLTVFNKNTYLKRRIKVEWIEQEKTNFTAIEMPLGTLITRTNGSISFTGNCKFLRYLRGNKVNAESIKDTIEQTKHFDQEELYLHLMDKMCYAIIKFGNNYVTHAGFQPHKHPSNTSREFSMYARKYDVATRTFTNNNSCPYWYEVKRDYPMFNLFFGHEVHEDKTQVADGIYAMDAGCVFGNALRMAIIENNEITFKETKSLQPKIKEKDMSWDYINKFEPYDKLVEQGYLRKQENNSLILYNYTEQCTYSKNWNKYTMECRGLILDKITAETIARPFSKFMNATELLTENEILSILNAKNK